MRIPERIKVGGRTLEVRIVDRIIDSQGACGRYIPDLGLIEVQEAQSADFMFITFLHELTHAIHDHMGLQDDERYSEAYVDAFANALHMVLKQNRSMLTDR